MIKEYKYKVKVVYLDANQARIISDLLAWDLWSPAEVEWKKRPSTCEWEVTGTKKLTPKLAQQARDNLTKTYEANGEKIESITFTEIGETL